MITTIRRFTDFEDHHSITNIEVSVAVKLTIVRFLNCSVILFATNNDVAGWFGGASLAYDASMLMLTMASSSPVFYALNIGGRMKKRKIEKLKAQQCIAGEDVVMTQGDANKLCEGPAVDIPNMLSNYFVLIMTCIFYAPLVPAAIPIAMMGSISFYISYKYMFLRVNKMPKMFGEHMATFFASLMPLILVIWAISYSIFVDKINKEFNKKFSAAHSCEEYVNEGTECVDPMVSEKHLSKDDKSQVWADSLLGVSFFILIIPIRTILHRMTPPIEEECNDRYKDVALSFPSDYDKENPLTMQKG